MRLILIRHGKPETSSDFQASNPPLSAVGHHQARRVADFLKHEPIDHVIHSGMVRAEQTASPLAETLGLKAKVIANLGEVDRYGGAYANMESIRAKGDAEWKRFLADPVGYFGVDADKFRSETLDGFASIFREHERETLAIFAHGFPINILLSHVLGLEGMANFVPDYGSISRLSGSDIDTLTVVSVNETAHQADVLAGALQ
ncbi:MAG: histidine phosphatase family protein [Sphingomonadales bacterium]